MLKTFQAGRPVLLRRYVVRLLSARPRWASTISSKAVEGSVSVPQSTVRLREYQEECIKAVLSYLRDGHKRLGISLATGSGKTVIFTQLINRVEPLRDGATQTIIVVHRRELVEQAARHCINAYPDKTVEIEMGNQHASGYADITVASILSLISGDRMQKFDPARFKLVLVDEAHHIVASSFMETLSHFGLLKGSLRADAPALIGVSATFSRFDGIRLSDAIDHIVYHKDYVDMIGEKWLSNVIFTTVKSKADISRVKNLPTGDFQVKDLSRAVNTQENNEVTFHAWQNRASGRQSTLVFCVDIAHVVDMTATFRKHGIDAKFVTSDTPKQIRSERLDAFKNRGYPVLLNCGVFTEGTDIPNIDCIILARPTKSRNLLVQMIGRGMRLYPGKENCHVIDMVASLQVGVVTTPTLFGLDPEAIITEANVKELKSEFDRDEREKAQEVGAAASEEKSASDQQLARRSLTFTDYESVYDLIDDTSGERPIRKISPLAWVLVGEQRYILSALNGSYITIEKRVEEDRDSFSVFFTQKMPEDIRIIGHIKSPFMRPREIAESKTFEDAVHAADTFALEKFPYKFISHNQIWRTDPATEGQLAFINKTRAANEQLTSDSITKGKAVDMITKIKFGAKGYFSKLAAAKKREQRASEKSRLVEELKRREQVEVGPVA